MTTRTLKMYIDEIEQDLNNPGLPIPWLIRKINDARRSIAKKTKCMRCWSSRNSDTTLDPANQYRIPHARRDDGLQVTGFVDIIRALDVKWAGKLIEELNEREMIHRLQSTSTGTPTHWCYFGGVAQPQGFFSFSPIPDTSGELIEVYAIQLPQPLIKLTDQCELNDEIQKIVIDKVKTIVLIGKWHPSAHLVMRSVLEDIKDNTTLEKL